MNQLPEQMLEDIIRIAMPNELNKERESLEFNFTFRIDQRKYATSEEEEEEGEGDRDSTSSTASASAGDEADLLYGFVLYRQKQLYIGSDDTRTSRPICQSLVMVSSPFLLCCLLFSVKRFDLICVCNLILLACVCDVSFFLVDLRGSSALFGVSLPHEPGRSFVPHPVYLLGYAARIRVHCRRV